MLDVFYPSLAAFREACAQVVAYLLSGESTLTDSPESYDPDVLLAQGTYALLADGSVQAMGY